VTLHVSINLILIIWLLRLLIKAIDKFELIRIRDLWHLSRYIIWLWYLTHSIIILHLILHKLVWTNFSVGIRYIIFCIKWLSNITLIIDVFSHLLPVVEELLLVHPLVLLVAHLVGSIILVHHLLLLLCHRHSLLILIPIRKLHIALLLHFIFILCLIKI